MSKLLHGAKMFFWRVFMPKRYDNYVVYMYERNIAYEHFCSGMHGEIHEKESVRLIKFKDMFVGATDERQSTD